MRRIPFALPSIAATSLRFKSFQNRFKCKVSVVTNSILIPTVLPLSTLASTRLIYTEYQIRGPNHLHIIRFQPNGTTVRFGFDPFGIFVDICFVRERVMRSCPHKAMTPLPEI